MKKETILVLCAHNDDQIVGMGGTFAKYTREGKDLYTVVFSYGELSHPHLKQEVVARMRVKESLKAAKILGGRKPVYLGIKEGRFEKELKQYEQKLIKLIRGKKPSKIFTHALDDPHADHRAVYHFVLELLDRMRYKGDLYSFDIWNPINIRKRYRPKMVVDVSDTFDIKIRAMDAHKSQWVVRIILWWNLYLKAMFNGLNNGVKYAEVFNKIR
jgi:LmbE family N-acetylglucosaminyl deacetylase